MANTLLSHPKLSPARSDGSGRRERAAARRPSAHALGLQSGSKTGGFAASRPSAHALGLQDGGLFAVPPSSKRDSETGGFAARRPIRPPRSYEELRERVRETLESGRLRAQKIVQKIQTEMFRRTGWWIHLYLKHEKKTRGRAPYGEKVVGKLASDLTHDKNFLYDALKVYQMYPIFRALGKLSVSHYRALFVRHASNLPLNKTADPPCLVADFGLYVFAFIRVLLGTLSRGI